MASYWSDCIESYDFATKRTAEAEVWILDNVASGSLYNYGNACFAEALTKAYDVMQEELAA